MFDKAKEMYALQKQAKELRKALQGLHFTAENPGGEIKVIANGEQEITSLMIELAERHKNVPDLLAREVLEVINKVMEKSKKGSAEKMRGMMGGSGLLGM